MHLNVVVFLITDIRVNEEGVEDIETLLGMVVHSEDEAYKLKLCLKRDFACVVFWNSCFDLEL